MSTPRRPQVHAEPAARMRSVRERPALAGVQLLLRRDRRLQLSRAEPGALFYVETGCLTLDARLADGRRQVLLTLFPGDTITQAFLPPLPDVGLTAAMASQLVRSHMDEVAKGDSRLSFIDIQSALGRLLRRSTLHTIVIGRLSGEERLATLLVDLGLHLGRETPGGLTFDLPLSRADMADYLALNPDTLSRLMSRLRARDLIALPSRRQAIARSFAELKALSPLSGTLEEIYAAGQRATVASD